MTLRDHPQHATPVKLRVLASPRTCLAIIFLILLGMACVRAALWQLDRAHAREALLQNIQAGSKARPIRLHALQPDGPDWHPASASGHWLNNFTLLLDNRNLNGIPGFWVATPLELQDSPGVAVLVLRGWLARPLPPAGLPDISAPSGLQTIKGTLLHQVPRMFDLASFSSEPAETLDGFGAHSDTTPPTVQNLSLEAFAAATRLQMLPVVIEQAPTDDAGLKQDWPGPAVDPGQNYSYAAQWLAFAGIAISAALIMMWRMLRRTASPEKQRKND